MIAKYKKFMLESNRIEGENRLNPGDIDAVERGLFPGIDIIGDLFDIHRLLGAYLKKDWVGKFRDVYIRVGSNHLFPSPQELPKLMEEYMRDFSHMDSYVSHNRFERIHPFRDLNGRVGRIIWLSKALDEGYDFSIPFLQAYYYQTLKRCES